MGPQVRSDADEKLPIKFAMFVEPRDIGIRYCYRLIDAERDYKAEIAFIIAHDALPLSYIDPRPYEDARAMHAMWEHTRRDSPGTFLDARNMGWFVEAGRT
jgi:hypothetical protein